MGLLYVSSVSDALTHIDRYRDTYIVNLEDSHRDCPWGNDIYIYISIYISIISINRDLSNKTNGLHLRGMLVNCRE